MQDEQRRVDITSSAGDHDADPPVQVETLRTRRKRELRQQLSDVATQLFLERGFEAVRVSDIATACGVTEKTIFNHFPCKEALLADRWELQTEAVRAALSSPDLGPVDAALRTLEGEVRFMLGTDTGRKGRERLKGLRRFSELIQSTPSLVAYHRRNLDDLMTTIATTLAQRTRTHPDHPEPAITAAAVTGLWSTLSLSLRRHLELDDITEIARAVNQDLKRAADVLRRGI